MYKNRGEARCLNTGLAEPSNFCSTLHSTVENCGSALYKHIPFFLSIRSGYKWLSGAGSEWPWSRGVWSRTTIAKHGFISWIAMHGKVVDKGEDDKDET